MYLYCICMYTHTPPLPFPPCSIVQGADWHWGPAAKAVITENSSGQPKYIRICALVTCILSFILLIAYLVYQVSRACMIILLCLTVIIYVHDVPYIMM